MAHDIHDGLEIDAGPQQLRSEGVPQIPHGDVGREAQVFAHSGAVPAEISLGEDLGRLGIRRVSALHDLERPRRQRHDALATLLCRPRRQAQQRGHRCVLGRWLRPAELDALELGGTKAGESADLHLVAGVLVKSLEETVHLLGRAVLAALARILWIVSQVGPVRWQRFDDAAPFGDLEGSPDARGLSHDGLAAHALPATTSLVLDGEFVCADLTAGESLHHIADGDLVLEVLEDHRPFRFERLEVRRCAAARFGLDDVRGRELV